MEFLNPRRSVEAKREELSKIHDLKYRLIVNKDKKAMIATII